MIKTPAVRDLPLEWADEGTILQLSYALSLAQIGDGCVVDTMKILDRIDTDKRFCNQSPRNIKLTAKNPIEYAALNTGRKFLQRTKVMLQGYGIFTSNGYSGSSSEG